MRTSVRILSVLILFLWPAAELRAAESKAIHPALLQRFEARVFTNAVGARLNYRLFKPAAFATETNRPLVLFLHGAAGLGDDNMRQFNGGNEVPPLALTEQDVQAKFPSFVFAPQCPRGSGWKAMGKEPSEMIRLTLAALDNLLREFHIDQRRVYVIGVSMGGHGAWDVAARFPRKFAAAVPICGVGETSQAAALVQLPIWCFHGADDRTVSVEHARRMIAALREAGGEPKYTEYPGVGHDSYRNAFREPELLPWLFARRSAW